MAFSGAVRVSDLSDFISPSQDCVVVNPGATKAKVRLQ